MPRFLLLLLAGLLLPARALGQECADAPPGAASASADLEGFRSLFQQGGVTFYSRVDAGPPEVARLAIHNANRVPVELGFSVLVVAAGGPAGGSEAGRHCVRLPANSFLADVEGVTDFGSAGGAVTGVRVRNLSLSLLGAGSTLARAQAPTPALPSAPAAAPARPPPAEAMPGFRCDVAGADPAARRACAARYEAASARAASVRGTFSGVTRACLLEYADAQAAAAARGAAPRSPSCFAPARARWDRTALARTCPGGVWTAADAGRTGCALLARFEAAGETVPSAQSVGIAATPPAAPPLPELPVTTMAVPRSEPPAAGTAKADRAATPAAQPTVPPVHERLREASSPPAIERAMGWVTAAVRGAAALVLVLAGIGLAIPVLVGLYALLILVPVALVGRAVRGAPVRRRAT